jgi:hypothetical protein
VAALPTATRLPNPDGTGELSRIGSHFTFKEPFSTP